jgi:hypothetical protein
MSRDFGAVLLGEFEQPDLVDRAQITGRQLERDVAAEFRNPEPAALHVDVLPAIRLDVGVRYVSGMQLALASDFTAGHWGRGT